MKKTYTAADLQYFIFRFCDKFDIHIHVDRIKDWLNEIEVDEPAKPKFTATKSISTP